MTMMTARKPGLYYIDDSFSSALELIDSALLTIVREN